MPRELKGEFKPNRKLTNDVVSNGAALRVIGCCDGLLARGARATAIVGCGWCFALVLDPRCGMAGSILR